MTGLNHTMGMRCLAYKEVPRNTLQGFASVEFASGLVIHEIAIHNKNDKWWAQPPSRPQMDGATARTDERGKIKYVPLVEFRDQATRERWPTGVVSCVAAYQQSA